jgi:hypothetical protein
MFVQYDESSIATHGLSDDPPGATGRKPDGRCCAALVGRALRKEFADFLTARNL